MEKEIRDGLCKLYCFDYDGALDAGKIEHEMQIQNLLSAIHHAGSCVVLLCLARRGEAEQCDAVRGKV